MKTMAKKMINGIDVEMVSDSVKAVAANPDQGMTHWNVTTRWMGGTRTDTRVTNYQIGGKTVEKDFTLRTDEPIELAGTNLFANPQEHLMAALNGCVMVTYVMASAMEGIELEELWLETEGDIDLRGLFALDPTVKPGYDTIRFKAHIKGNGTPEQFQRIHEKVQQTSPNFFTVANAVKLEPELVVE